MVKIVFIKTFYLCLAKHDLHPVFNKFLILEDDFAINFEFPTFFYPHIFNTRDAFLVLNELVSFHKNNTKKNLSFKNTIFILICIWPSLSKLNYICMF